MSITNKKYPGFPLLNKCKSILNIKKAQTADNSLTLTIELPADVQKDSIRFLVQKENDSLPKQLSFCSTEDSSFLLDLSPLKEEVTFGKKITFCFFIECIQNGVKQLYALKEETPPSALEDRYRLFSQNLWLSPSPDVLPAEYVGITAGKVNMEDFFCAALCSRNHYLELSHRCNLRFFKMPRGKLRICFDVETGSYEYIKTELAFRSKLASDAAAYDFETVSAKRRGKLLRVTASLDLKKIQWKSLYWGVDVYLKDSVTGNTGKVSITMNTPFRMFLKFLYNRSLPGEKNFFLFPYYTATRKLAFTYREKNPYDGLDVVFKEFLSMFLYRIAKPYWKKKHILLVCEKFSSMAQDNGYYFFKHCMDDNEEAYLKKNIYYIITKDSPDRDKLAPYKDHVLDFMSIRHMCYLLAADLIVSSDSRYHTYPLQSRHSVFNRDIKKIPFVFLQHGVIALKRVDNFYGKGQKGGCDLFVVSTNAEKKIIVDNFGYEPEEVINTGLPRWDVLKDKSQGKREILIMPTWRNWLDSVPDKDFEESDYFRSYMSLLNSQRLADILEKYDLEINFYLHAKFQEYSDQFQSKSHRIHLISFGDVAVNEMLMRCRMLITDYSSVCWDVLYQDKPSLFYQFDLDKYDEAHGSYLDMKTELFGDRAENEEQLLTLLEEQIKNDFRLKPQYEEMRKTYFQFKDQAHSRHICEEIKEKLL